MKYIWQLLTEIEPVNLSPYSYDIGGSGLNVNLIASNSAHHNSLCYLTLTTTTSATSQSLIYLFQDNF
jgi:hypothetical protein